MTGGTPPRQVVVGLDVGTTAVKAVAFGVRSEWRHAAQQEYPLLEPRPGWQVQDPDVVVEAVRTALADTVAACRPADVLAISVSTAMHGLVALDERMQPLTMLLTWADARAGEQARALRASGRAAELHRRTGAPVHPMTPLTKLMWFAEHEPEVCRSARHWVGLKEYVLLRLTGVLVTELSSASGTGMIDLATRQWDPEVVASAGIALDQLPPILATTDTRPLTRSAADSVGLPAGTPVVLGAGDGPLGNVGVDAVTPGIAGLSLGTSGALRLVLPAPQVDEAGRLFCYALTETAWAVGGAVSNGGVVVRWTEHALAPDLGADGDVDAALLTLAGEAPPGCDGLVMLPYLLAERAPLWDPDLPGAYLGLRREHTRSHLIRAAVEGVCLQMSTLADELHKLRPVTAVRATGGTFRSELWRTVMAAAIGRPFVVVGDAEGSALGAAVLALLALGEASTLSDGVAQLSGTDRSLPAPTPVSPELVATYQRLRDAVPGHIRALDPVAQLFDR